MQGSPEPDIELGQWVYCQSHVGPHSTGWCTVDIKNKLPLKASNRTDAVAECKAQRLPISGHCTRCYKFIANEHPYAQRCPDHD